MWRSILKLIVAGLLLLAPGWAMAEEIRIAVASNFAGTLKDISVLFEKQTGLEIKPEGACLGDRCVPLPGQLAETLDLGAISDLLAMPLVHDETAGLWALGPESGGKALVTAQAPDLELPDRNGQTFRLASQRGQKVLMIAWASW